MRFQRSKGNFSPLSFSFTVYNRTLRLTKEGVFFIILTLGIGFAAINTGINLLYLILAMCLSFIIVSGVLSELTLRNIYMTRTIPVEIFAGQSFPVQVEIKNKKKWFPTYSIWLEEDISTAHNKNITLNPSVGSEKALSKGDTGLSVPKIYFYHIKAGDSVEKTVLWVLPQRGLFKTNGIKVSTRYPFGFFVKTALINKPEERVVYPAIRSLNNISDQLDSMGEITSNNKGEGSDIFGFRGFTHGDSSRMIHWKTSAKVNELMIKEHFEEESRKIAIIFDNLIDGEKSKSNSKETYEKFDEGVIQAASLANYFIRNEYQVKMVTHCQNIPCGSGYGHLSIILYHLALLEPADRKTDLLFQNQEKSEGVIRLSYAGEYL